MLAIDTVFRSHIYSFHYKFHRQLKGGAIGSRLTEEVCKILMDVWITRFTEVLRLSGVDVYLLLKYVDDVNIMTSHIKAGLR